MDLRKFAISQRYTERDRNECDTDEHYNDQDRENVIHHRTHNRE